MGRRYLVVGAGGREHALAWKLAQGADVESVWVAPGNAGIAADPDITGCLDIAVGDFSALEAFAKENDVTLTVVGPEAPLVDGIVDHFQSAGLAIFGPSAAAAQLEASKAFSKEVMRKAEVPTANFAVFDDEADAIAHIEMARHPLVIKADGLAGGKGVVISQSVDESRETLQSFMAGAKFGESSKTVLIEDFLEGPELSFIVVTDGENVVPLATSRDHKRVGEGDTGPNTGGMGAITPSPNDSLDLQTEIVEMVIRPVLRQMKQRGAPFSGFLYAGLMLTQDGPYVLEFNVRMGDPETQPLLFALNADFGALLESCVAGTLKDGRLSESDAACAIVLASAGYPATPQKGFVIEGLDTDFGPHTKVFHAGTTRDDSGAFINNGGRVLAVTARGASPADARERAYEAAQHIHWEGMHFRRDIGV